MTVSTTTVSSFFDTGTSHSSVAVADLCGEGVEVDAEVRLDACNRRLEDEGAASASCTCARKENRNTVSWSATKAQVGLCLWIWVGMFVRLWHTGGFD